MFKFLPNFKRLFQKFSLVSFCLLIFFVNVSLFNLPTIFAADSISPNAVAEGTWVKDDDVTFAGKSAARSGKFLDWTLENYSWSSFSGTSGNPLASFWTLIRNIVYAFITIFVLVSAFVIIVTRGRSLTLMRFIPRFVMIILLVTLSFSIVQFIYQIMDAIQGFFLTNSSKEIISQKDLLFVGFEYKTFDGFRLFGSTYDESVFVSLLLVKLTAFTYYVMTGVLLLRKIILWFFIIISPVFPLLLFYSPIRNTAKIWVGEFFRWLLYAPIFAIFLSGLVHMWALSNGTLAGIPLNFNFNKPEEYKTAISILIGGPGQTVSLNNSINNPDTFALYVVALLMLWVVIILPFLLLQIFLDFFHDFAFSENSVVKQLVNSGTSLIGRGKNPPPPPPSSTPSGIAKPLPFFSAKIAMPEIRANQAVTTTQATNIQTVRASSEMLSLTNLSVPTMQDIAKYETSLLSSSISGHQEMARVHETLESIADPKKVTSPVQRQRFDVINEKLKQEAQRGDPLATSILSAAKSVTTQTSSVDSSRLTKVFTNLKNVDSMVASEDKQRITAIKAALADASHKGDPLATSILDSMKKEDTSEMSEDIKKQLMAAKEQGNQLAVSILYEAGLSEAKLTADAVFPVANRVQSVSIDDYESVKKIWQENYQKLEPPKSIDGKQRNRKEWVSGDIDKISEAINLLVSSDPQNVSKGMESVGAILPFLLIGGFAQTEVVAYLKAKLEAAKTVVGEIDKQQGEEDTKLEAGKIKTEAPKEMSMMAEKEDVKESDEDENKIN